MSAVLDYLPRGNTLSDDTWKRRHELLQGLLALHLPLLFAFGLARGVGLAPTAEALAAPLACLVLGRVLRSRRPASLFITAGLVYCSAALVAFSDGAIEAHFHFFIIIGFIALYQDWVPFLLNILFTVLSHGIGSSFVPDLMFNHTAAQNQPWTWSLIHGVAVLAACVGVVLFWRTTEEEQQRSLRLTEQLTAAELSRRRFTSDLLVNLARRNQNLLHRQLSLLNQLEDKEADPDALADLFRLDHLATRIRRNAESLLVLSGEESPRTWRGPVPLVDVVRAAIAEIEDLDRVDFAVDESLAVSGRGVADLTHLLAELLENAVRFSPPGVTVMLRSRPYQPAAGAQVITIEDWGVGMTPAELADVNDLLRRPRDVDLSVSQRLGLHVVARLAHRYGISVELTATPGGGVTAVVLLPRGVFSAPDEVSAGEPARPVRPAEPAMERAGRPAGPPSAMLPAATGADQRAAPAPDRRPALTGSAPDGRPAADHRPIPERRPAPAAAPAPVAAPARADDGLPPLPRRAPGSALRRDEATGTATARPAPAPFAADPVDDDSWSSWWARPTADAGPPPPRRPADAGPPPPRRPAGDAPPPVPAAARPAAPALTPRAGNGNGPTLSRRVPQANLAAGLRRTPSPAPPPAEPATVRDPAAARDALSRFQASQRAARATVDEELSR